MILSERKMNELSLEVASEIIDRIHPDDMMGILDKIWKNTNQEVKRLRKSTERFEDLDDLYIAMAKRNVVENIARRVQPKASVRKVHIREITKSETKETVIGFKYEE
jgi:hypothetical protein